MPAPILKLFAHYDDEYDYLAEVVLRHGLRSNISSATSFYVAVKDGFKVKDLPLRLLGVRHPDPYRMQVGCGDYEVEDFEAFTTALMKAQPAYARPVHNAHGLAMIELWYPDFDVLGYLVPPKDY
jgi:hypothetical protein